MKNILGNNVAFMDDCLAKGVITIDALQAFAKKQGPDIKLIINWAASTQVKHWMGVMDEWKAMLGPDFDKTFARIQHDLRGAPEQRAVLACWRSISAPRRSTTG